MFWKQKGSRIFYGEEPKEQTIERLKEKSIENKKVIEELSKRKTVMANTNHSITHRLSAVEFRLKKMASQPSEYNVKQYEELLEELETLQKEYMDSIKDVIDIDS